MVENLFWEFIRGMSHPARFCFQVQQAFEKPNVKAQMPTIERMSMTKPFYLFPGNWK